MVWSSYKIAAVSIYDLPLSINRLPVGGCLLSRPGAPLSCAGAPPSSSPRTTRPAGKPMLLKPWSLLATSFISLKLMNTSSFMPSMTTRFAPKISRTLNRYMILELYNYIVRISSDPLFIYVYLSPTKWSNSLKAPPPSSRSQCKIPLPLVGEICIYFNLIEFSQSQGQL